MPRLARAEKYASDNFGCWIGSCGLIFLLEAVILFSPALRIFLHPKEETSGKLS